MLSRVATQLYVLGRSLEQAEHVARLLRVHAELSLDRSVPSRMDFWPRFLTLVGVPPSHFMRRQEAIVATRRQIGSAIESARTAAQGVRILIPTEVYEHLNGLHWRVRETDPDVIGLYEDLRSVELGLQLLTGLFEDGMGHDEAWNFLRLGKSLERARATTRLFLQKYSNLEAIPDDAIEWAAVLRCSTSFEAYRTHVSAPVSARGVSRFLLLDYVNPHSAAFSVDVAARAIQQIDGSGPKSRPARVLSRMRALFRELDVSFPTVGLDRFQGEFMEVSVEVEQALRQAYFRPSRRAVQLPDAELSRQPQQQQQS